MRQLRLVPWYVLLVMFSVQHSSIRARWAAPAQAASTVKLLTRPLHSAAALEQLREPHVQHGSARPHLQQLAGQVDADDACTRTTHPGRPERGQVSAPSSGQGQTCTAAHACQVVRCAVGGELEFVDNPAARAVPQA